MITFEKTKKDKKTILIRTQGVDKDGKISPIS